MRTTLPRVKRTNRRGVEASARVGRMLEAARVVMLRRGYQDASLDEILRRSGGSKATLVKYFRNKAGLFGAVIADVARRCVEDAERAFERRPPEQALQAFGEAMLRFYLQPDSLLAYRGVIAEGARQRALAQAFLEKGHGRFVACLAYHLSAWSERGLVRTSDPEGDADRFLHLIRAGWHERWLIGLGSQVSAGELRRQVAAAVRLFLHGIH